MILDILLVAIVILSAIHGYRKGFVHTLIRSVGWVGAVVLAYLITPTAMTLFTEYTGFYDVFYSRVATKIDVSLESIDALVDSLPDSISASLDSTSSNIVDGVTSEFTTIFGTVVVFALCFILIRLLLALVLHLFSKDYNGGVIHFADGLFGMLFGFLCGGILVLVFCALLLPASNLLSPSISEWISSQIAASHITAELYDENFLLLLLDNYMHSTTTVEESSLLLQQMAYAC